MAAVKIPARDIIIEVESAVAATWVELEGLISATPDPAANEAATDTTDFDSNGLYSQMILQRGSSFAAEGHTKKDDTTGVQVTGQLRVQTVAKAVGQASIGRIRFRHPMDTSWVIWDCTMSGGIGGGGTNDLTGWAATFVRCGDETTAAVV